VQGHANGLNQGCHDELKVKKEKGKVKSQESVPLLVATGGSNDRTQYASDLARLLRDRAELSTRHEFCGIDQAQPVVRFPRLLECNVHLGDKVGLALSSLSFGNVCPNGSSRLEELISESTTYTGTLIKSKADFDDPQGELKGSRFDVRRLARLIGHDQSPSYIFPFSFFTFHSGNPV
jgi:hypothetical protein